jgi:hypothetical protein
VDGLKSRINRLFNENCSGNDAVSMENSQLVSREPSGWACIRRRSTKITRRACAGIRRRKGDGDGSKDKKSIGEWWRGCFFAGLLV